MYFFFALFKIFSIFAVSETQYIADENLNKYLIVK